MEMFRVACLGAGYFAQFHLDAWQRAEQAELVAVADKDIEKAKQAGVAAFSSLTEMLDKTKPDILDIILPPDQRGRRNQNGNRPEYQNRYLSETVLPFSGRSAHHHNSRSRGRPETDHS